MEYGVCRVAFAEFGFSKNGSDQLALRNRMAKSKAQRLKQWYRRVSNNPSVDHYAMLGIELFEDDLEAVEAAAIERLEILQKMSNAGIDVDSAKDVMTRVTKAKMALSNLKKKRAYDRNLKHELNNPTETEPEDSVEGSNTGGADQLDSLGSKKIDKAQPISRSSSEAKLARSSIRQKQKSVDKSKFVFIAFGLISCTAATVAAVVFVNQSLSKSQQVAAILENGLDHLPEVSADAGEAREGISNSDRTRGAREKKSDNSGVAEESNSSKNDGNLTKTKLENDPASEDAADETFGNLLAESMEKNNKKKPSKAKNMEEEVSNDRAQPESKKDSSDGKSPDISNLLGAKSDSDKKPAPASKGDGKKPKAVAPGEAPKYPFKEFRKHFSLPGAGNKKEVKIDNLVISNRFRMGLELIFDKAWARNKIDFSIKRDDEDKQRWIVSTTSKSGNGDPVAQFWRDDSAFYFQWLEDANKNEDVNYLKNAAVRMSTPDGQEGFLNLRAPVPIKGFKLAKDQTSVESKVEIPWLPASKNIRVEVAGFEDPQIASHCLPEVASREPARMFFVRQEKDAYIWMEIRATGKAHGFELSSKLMMAGDPGQPVQPFVMSKLAQSKKAFADQMEKLRGELKREKDQKKKNQINGKIKNAQKVGGILTVYSMVLDKLPGRDIPVKIYLDGPTHQVLVAQTPVGGKKK